MTKTLLTLIFIGLISISFGQSTSARKITPLVPPTNVERYGIDYEIKDYIYNEADSSLINSIDLMTLESLREQNNDTEVIDPSSGLIIILYFEKKTKTTNPSTNQEL